MSSRSSVPAFAIPTKRAIEEVNDIIGKHAEKCFAFIGSGVPRVANVTGRSSILGDPAATCRLKRIPKIDWLDTFEIPHKLRRDTEHHGGFPFASVAHVRLFDGSVHFMRLAAQSPVRREQEKQILALSVSLTHFKHSLFTGHIVAAVAVDQNQPLESVLDEVFQQPRKEIEINARRCGKRAGEIEVMIGVAEPLERREDDTFVQSQFCPANDLAQQHAVGKERHVAAMLFERSHRKHDGGILAQRGKVSPLEVGEVHARLS